MKSRLLASRWLGAFLLLLANSPAWADDTDLAKKAQDILKANCHRCHGKDGNIEGGMNYILDRDKLVSSRKIIPGQADQSPLYKKLASGKMPPEDEQPRPSAADIALLKQWIDKGAPPAAPVAKRPFISESDIVATIRSDLEKLDRRQRRFTRYFTLGHLANIGLSDDELQTYRNALSKLLNSLSWHQRIWRPQPVDEAKTILRIDLRDFQWDLNTWNRILQEYPHGIIHDTAAARAVYVATATKMPYVRGDWFVATASRPPLYQDVLQLPTTDRELERQVRVDVTLNIQQERVARAGFNSSGVSRNSRMLERHDSVFGAYWRSYDFADNVGRHNLFAFPLGPGLLENQFEHAGGEIIFNLPNGLQAYMLVDGLGRRVDKAPLTIVSDPKRPDRAVETGISCMSCHTHGIQFKTDQIRDHVDKSPKGFSKGDIELIKALYVPEAKFKALQEEDAERFRKAVEKTGGRLSSTEPITVVTLRYEGELDLPTAAAELGLPAEEFLKRIEGSPALTRSLGSLKVPGGTVQRQVFFESMLDTVRELRLGTVFQPALDGLPLVDYGADVDPFEGLTAVMNAVAFSADGRRALFASSDKTVRLWDIQENKELRRFIGHTASVWSVAFSSNGKRAISGSADKTVRLWDIETGQELRRFDGHASLVTSVAFSRDGRRALSAGYDHVVYLWDVESGRELRAFKGQASYINTVSFSADGRRALIGGEKTLYLWNLETGEEAGRLVGHASTVTSAAFSPDGRRILSCGDDKTIRLWDAENRTQIRAFEGDASAVGRLAFSPDGRWAITGGPDRTPRIWNVETGKEVRRFKEQPETVVGVAFSSDGRRALAGNRDGTVRVWELADPVGATPPSQLPSDPKIEHLPPAKELTPAAVVAVDGNVTKIALSPNGRWLYYLKSYEGKIGRVDTSSMQRDRELAVAPGTETLCLSRDGKTLFASLSLCGHRPNNFGNKPPYEGRIQVISVPELKLEKAFTIAADPYDLQPGSDGILYVSGGSGEWTDVAVVDIQREAIVARWGGIWSRSFMRLSPDAKRLYFSTQDVSPGEISTLPIPTGSGDRPAVQRFPNREGHRLTGEFLITPDGKHLLSQTGVVLRLDAVAGDDLQHVETMEPFLGAAADAELAVTLAVTRDGVLRIHSYPEFQLQGTYRLGAPGSQVAFAVQQGRLYVSAVDPQALGDRPRARSEVRVYDLKAVLQGGPKAAGY